MLPERQWVGVVNGLFSVLLGKYKLFNPARYLGENSNIRTAMEDLWRSGNLTELDSMADKFFPLGKDRTKMWLGFFYEDSTTRALSGKKDFKDYLTRKKATLDRYSAQSCIEYVSKTGIIRHSSDVQLATDHDILITRHISNFDELHDLGLGEYFRNEFLPRYFKQEYGVRLFRPRASGMHFYLSMYMSKKQGWL